MSIKLTPDKITFENAFGEAKTRQRIDAIIFDNRKSIAEYGTVYDYLVYDLLQDDNVSSWMNSEMASYYETLEQDEQSEISDLLVNFIFDNFNYLLN
jgi:hypothetical protein